MKILPLSSGCIALGCLTGCGGSGTSVAPSNAPNFYSGTITVTGTAGISSGTAPIVANITGGNMIEGYLGSSQILGTVSVTPGSGTLSQGGAYLKGEGVESFGPSSVSFHIVFNGKTVATATLSKAVPPALGTAVSVPPAGTYSGEEIVMNDGVVSAYGTLAGSVDAAGNWRAQGITTSPSDTGGIYGGSLATAGTIPLLSYTSYAGYVSDQSTPAPYSFDGKTLIVRVDSLSFAGVGWLVMTRQ